MVRGSGKSALCYLSCDTKSPDELLTERKGGRERVNPICCYRYPTGTCGRRKLAVRSSRDNVASPTRRRLNREGESRLLASRRSGARVGGMANTCEPLINVVSTVQPKMLTGWDQKGMWSVQRLAGPLPQTSQPPAERRSLTHRAHQTERGKPVALPQGQPTVRRAHGAAGRG